VTGRWLAIAVVLATLLWGGVFALLLSFSTPGCHPQVDLSCGIFYPIPDLLSWACLPGWAFTVGWLTWMHWRARRRDGGRSVS
jgi:hypothetical protein